MTSPPPDHGPEAPFTTGGVTSPHEQYRLWAHVLPACLPAVSKFFPLCAIGNFVGSMYAVELSRDRLH